MSLSYWSETDFLMGIVYVVIAIVLSALLKTKKTFFFLISIFHFFITIYYWNYSLFNVADSTFYYGTVVDLTTSWGDLFGSDITFIRFLLYPLIYYLRLNYLGCFFVFSLFGLLGFYFLFKIYINYFNVSYVFLFVLFLPQLHFWTCALGKDSVIFFALSYVLYLWFYKKKLIYYLLPLLLIGFIRIHILLFLLLAYGMANMCLKSGKFSVIKKILIITFVLGAFIFLFPILGERINVSNISDLQNYLDESSTKYSRSGNSSVDLSSSFFIVKVFSYLFRPLFIDAWSVLSLEASIENLIWLVVVFFIIRYIFRYKKDLFSRYRKEILLPIFIFVMILVPFAYTLSNLGIAMRQKNMLFPFVFYLLVYLKHYRIKNATM